MDTKNVQGMGQLRNIKAEINILTCSDGSVLYSQGQTTVLASVHGPVEVKLQNLSAEKAFIEVYYRPKNGLPSVKDRFMEKIIQESSDTVLLSGLHPRTSYKIQVQELEDDGGLLSSAINATMLAILNSGLEIQNPLAAVYCTIDSVGEVVLDPPKKSIKTQDPDLNTVTFVFDAVKRDAIAVHNDGKLTPEQYKIAMHLCKAASEDVFKIYRKIFMNFVKII